MSQQLIVNISSSTIIDFASLDVNHRVVTTAEAFLLTHICGPLVAADVIARVDARGNQNVSGLSRYIRYHFQVGNDIGKIFSKYTLESVDAYLESPFFGERPNPVKRSRGKTDRASTEPAESSEDKHAHGDRLLAMDIDVVLNHTSASDPLLPDAVDRLIHHEHQLKRARTCSSHDEDPRTIETKESAEVIIDCPYVEGDFVRVRARTSPGISARESVSFVAKFLRPIDNTFCHVVPLLERQKKRKVLISSLEAASFDGLDALSRNGKPSAQAIKRVNEAERERRIAVKEKDRLEVDAARDAKRAHSELKKVKTAAEVRVRRARRMAKASVVSVRAQLKAAVAALVLGAKREHLAKDELRSFHAKASLAAAKLVRRTVAQCNFAAKKKAIASKRHSRKEIKTFVEAAQRAESAATAAAADADELRSSRVAWTRKQQKDFQKRGRTQARVAFDDAAVKNRRLEAALEHERLMGKKAKRKHDEAFAEAEQKALNLRALKNEMAKRARSVEKKLIRMKNAKKNMNEGLKRKSTAKLPAAFRERLDDAQADVIAAEVAMEAMQEEIDRLRKINVDLTQAHRLLKLKLGASGVNFENLPVGTKSQSSKVELWRLLGVRGESYCQDVIELGLTLMAAQLSAEQAVDVLRAFLRLEYPEKIEGTDYRIPDASRFREWRRYLEPICHFVRLSVIKLSDQTHVSHDATTKNGVHVLQTCVRCEIANESGEIMVVDVPLKFEICPSGEAKHEARHISDAFHSPLLGGLHAALTSIVSATSDNAARATSRELEILKAKEVEEVKKFLTPVIDQVIEAYPPELQAAVDAFLAMADS